MKVGGTADEILNLPSGGGSVSGQGGDFSVDLNTGTATAKFDLTVPSGPNGIMPPCTLQYSAGSGDGLFGMGWSFNLMTIRRKITPSATAPDLTAPGAYSLVGVGDLVAMDGNRFRPMVDSTGFLIEFDGTSWTVTDKSDTQYTLGTTANAQIGATPPAAWLVDRCADSAGNAITYTWMADGTGRLLQSIAWGTYQLVFQYENRPDIVADGSYGMLVTLDKRCSSIELHVTTEAQNLVRSWALLYEDTSGRGRSLLSVIRELGHAADGSILPAPDRSFAYSTMGPPEFVPVTGWTTPLNDPDTDLADLNGDGLPDIVTIGLGLPTIRPNMGGGRFGPPQALARTAAPLRLSAPSVTFADMSGNGNVDLLVLGQSFSGYYPLSAPSGAAPTGFGLPVVFEQAPAVLPGDPHVRFLDLNGDGITDILVDTGRGWLVYLREGINTWSPEPRVLPPELTPPVTLTDPHVYLADMTGDGLTDIVRARGSSITYWPARADGGWGTAMTMSPAPQFTRDHDPRRLILYDVDGDGCADLVYVDVLSVTLWRNVGAGQLSAPMVIADTPPAALGSFRIVDLLGTGTAGVHFQLPAFAGGASRQTFLDLSAGIKPYLLTDLANGASQSSHVSYRTSTAFAQDDAAGGAPWPTYHPFAIQCVARTDQTDHATGVATSTQYAYHDGRYDPGTRTFLGFGRVDVDQLGDASCPTLRVETTFHLGLDPTNPTRPLFGDEALTLGALRRKPLTTTTYGLDGSALASQPFSVTTHRYDALLVASMLGNGNKVAVPYCESSTEQRWERQAAVLSTRVVEYLAVNSEGDVTQQRTQAQRTGVATPDQDVTTTTTLATGGTNLRLPARVTQTAPDGTIISETVVYYDGDPFIGLPEGQATQGLITRTEDRVFDDSFVASLWGATPPDLTQYGYHRLAGDATGWWRTRRSHQRIAAAGGKGPSLVTKGPLGAVQTLQYDTAGQRVLQVTDAAGNLLSATVNARVFQTESLTDANGNTTSDVFDALGRVTATIGPLDSAGLPSMTFSYAPGAVSSVVGSARVTHGGAELVPATTWIDGVGRVLGKATPAAAAQWIVTGAVLRNMRGAVAASYLPYTVSGTAWQPPPVGTAAATSLFDALGRMTQLTRTDGLVVTTRRDGDMVTINETWPGGAPVDVERQVYDAAGQLISVSRNAGDHWVEQQYSYAPSGKVSAVVLPGGTQVTFTLDLLGRIFAQQSPDTGHTRFLIDAGDNQRLRGNAAGQSVRADIDAMNRVIAVYHDAETTPRIRYEFLDKGGSTPADGITSNRYARLWRVTDEIGTVVFQYDEAGRVTSTVRNVAATGQSFINQTNYDAMGRITSVTLPPPVAGGKGRSVAYTYGGDGRLASASGIVSAAQYDLYGRLTSLTYASGASTLIDYAANAGAIQRVRVLDASLNVLRDTTTARGNGLLQSVTSATANDDNVAYAYDGMRRLAGATYSRGGTTTDSHEWSFDDSFALTASSDSGALTYKAGTHQLAAVGGKALVFDAAGRMTTGRYGTGVFDAADHLTGGTLPDSTVFAHTYDYKGRRALSTTAGAQSYFCPASNIEYFAGTAVVWIRFGNQRVAADMGGVLSFIHPNALGAFDLITDATGAYAAHVRQTPFGLARPAAGTPPAGAAQTLAAIVGGNDPSGLIMQGVRWYDPVLGQFISPDPMVTSVYALGSWNPYVFCLGNPILFADPSGADFLSALEFIGIAVLAAACVVGAIFTGGATLVALGVISANIGGWLLVGVAVGSLGGALAGELAAQKAGGSLWAGAFVGALLGGATSLAGGALGAAVSDGIDSLINGTQCLVAPTFESFVAAGAIQGTLAGAGTGLAIGFAGGKGTAEQALTAMAKGAAWGATLGALLGAATGGIAGSGFTGTDTPDRFLNWGAFDQKFADFSSFGKFVNSADNAGGLTESFVQIGSPGGLNAPDLIGLLPNLVTTSNQAAGWWSWDITWLAPAVLSDAGFAGAVNASMAMDQAGFSYAHQLFFLVGAAPYFIDYAATMWQIADQSGQNSFEKGFNNAFGSASPTDTG
jgi:RHS repeat-associated protein